MDDKTIVTVLIAGLGWAVVITIFIVRTYGAVQRDIGERVTRDHFDKKIEGLSEKLDDKIEGLAEKFDGKIEGLSEKFDGKIEGLSEKLDDKIEGLSTKLDDRVEGLSEKFDNKIEGLRVEFDKLPKKEHLDTKFDALTSEMRLEIERALGRRSSAEESGARGGSAG